MTNELWMLVISGANILLSMAVSSYWRQRIDEKNKEIDRYKQYIAIYKEIREQHNAL